MQACEERIRLAIGQSNFYSEKFSADQDKIAFGTSAMLIEERAKPPRGVPFGGLLFRTIPIGEWCIEEGPDGMVDTLCRCFQMSARAIVMQWQDKASEHAHTLADKRPDERLTLIHAVYPRIARVPAAGHAGPALRVLLHREADRASPRGIRVPRVPVHRARGGRSSPARCTGAARGCARCRI